MPRTISNRGAVLKQLRKDGRLDDSWTAEVNALIDEANQQGLATENIFPLPVQDRKADRPLEVKTFEHGHLLGKSFSHLQTAIIAALSKRVTVVGMTISAHEMGADRRPSRESLSGGRSATEDRRRHRDGDGTSPRSPIHRDSSGHRSIFKNPPRLDSLREKSYSVME
jgi:hypothetical protein